jgi:hypothetical protein
MRVMAPELFWDEWEERWLIRGEGEGEEGLWEHVLPPDSGLTFDVARVWADGGWWITLKQARRPLAPAQATAWGGGGGERES